MPYKGFADRKRQRFVIPRQQARILLYGTEYQARGNDPESRKRVLDVVMGLVDTGFLESRGSDFYLLTDKGRKAITR